MENMPPFVMISCTKNTFCFFLILTDYINQQPYNNNQQKYSLACNRQHILSSLIY